MKLGSRECRLVLEKMIPESEMERMAIEVLLTDSKDVANLPGMREMSHTQLDLLVYNIRKIRERVGIEDEA